MITYSLALHTYLLACLIAGSATFAQCAECPYGADCSTVGVTQTTLTSLAGYWRSNAVTLEWYRCLVQEHCPGGAADTCQAHRVDPMCAVCEDRYISYFGGECVECPTYNNSVVFLLCISVLMVGVYMTMIYVVIRGGRHLLDEETRLAHARAVRLGLVDEDETETSPAADNAKGASHDDTTAVTAGGANPHTVELTQEFLIKRPAEFMFKMKIILGFLQIITNLGISLSIPWPEGFAKFISFFRCAAQRGGGGDMRCSLVCCWWCNRDG